MRCEAAEDDEADPGDAKQGCGTSARRAAKREQRHGKHALGDIEDGADRVANIGVIPHGDREARRAGGGHEERQHHEGDHQQG